MKRLQFTLKQTGATLICGLLLWGAALAQGGSGRTGGSSGNAPAKPRNDNAERARKQREAAALAKAKAAKAKAAKAKMNETTGNASINGNEVHIRTNAPLISLRLMFMRGAAYDPSGKEGVAALTAAMLARGGSRALSYEQIVNAMYPMATSFSEQVDKEMTVFAGTTHADNLDAYYNLTRQMLLEPGFREDDFRRLKDEALNYLKTSLREENDEELGKEALYLQIYGPQHPYGHHNAGTVSALENMTLQDVKDFYAANYTQANLVIGLAGGFTPKFAAQVKADFARLPAGTNDAKAIPAPQLAEGMKIDIIRRETRSTAISLGFPVNLNRADKSWPALALVASYFGQHRSSNSYLYQRLREVRGLNYGDYAYIEYFPNGMFQFQPAPNLGRARQIFQIWIRPVEVKDGHFALRAALFEYERLTRDGLSPEAFASTRDFLMKNVNLLVADQDSQLGYLLDSRYYNIGEYTAYMRDALKRLTLADVNAAIRSHLKTSNMRVVMVTKEADALREAIIANKPSPIIYNTPKPQAVLDEDKLIQGYNVNVRPENVTVTPVERIFQ
jgi:zinc protease